MEDGRGRSRRKERRSGKIGSRRKLFRLWYAGAKLEGVWGVRVFGLGVCTKCFFALDISAMFQ